jgi:hypothetical protein
MKRWAKYLAPLLVIVPVVVKLVTRKKGKEEPK